MHAKIKRRKKSYILIHSKVFALDKITSDELFGSIAETTQNFIKKNLEGFKQ